MSVHAEPPPLVVSEPHGIKYATGPQLGKGGFAICHQAELYENSKPTGRIVALKIVKSKMEPPKLAQKFVTELQLHSKLHHPNIVEFYRAFSFDQSTYVVLEMCENGSLADALRKRKTFTMPEIRRFIIQICGAVKYLHTRSVVHRDLKTGNIFLDKDMNIKVGDFGLAAVVISQKDLGIRRTTMCGTPNYLAPEILEKGGKGHNEKVDLWAIGIIAYTLAVGKAPFHASKREDIYKKLQAREYKWPDISKTQNDISNDLRDLVGSLLVHEDDRPCPDQIVSHPFFKMTFIPDRLDKDCTLRAPRWTNIRPPTARVIQQGYSDNWFKICKDSGVGEYAPGKTFPVYGGRKLKSVVKDCEKEIQAGRQPVVPVPADTVYVPFPERNDPLSSKSNNLSEITEEKESSGVTEEGQALVETTANDRAPPAPKLLAGKPRTRRSKENTVPEQPVEILERPSRSTRSDVESAARVATSGRTTRESQKDRPLASADAIISRVVRDVKTVMSRRTEERSVRSEPMVIHDSAGETETKQPTPVPDKLMIPHTDPASVLARVSKFRDNIAEALASTDFVPRRSSRTKDLPFVSKWVDYSKRHGVGYVLEDGSIGCVYNATQRHPVTHVVVRDGYSYLREEKEDPGFIERVPFEFYTDCGENGIRKANVDKDRKRSTGLLWSKFGRYMCQRLGQAEGCGAHAEAGSQERSFVRFYQRLGTVGIWGFDDGAFQFNFPDHTKLVLSSDGVHARFTCLSLEAAMLLAQRGDLADKYIRQRKVLTGRLMTLLYGPPDGDTVSNVADANLLKAKLKFIINVVDAWVSGGGLGCLPQHAQKLDWDGPLVEDVKRQEWVTIGRFGGDAAKS